MASRRFLMAIQLLRWIAHSSGGQPRRRHRPNGLPKRTSSRHHIRIGCSCLIRRKFLSLSGADPSIFPAQPGRAKRQQGGARALESVAHPLIAAARLIRFTDSVKQSFPPSQGLLFVPPALKGDACARPELRAKIAVSSELKNSIRECLAIARRHREAASSFVKQARDFSILGTYKESWAAGGGDAVEFARHDQTFQTRDRGS